jgi:putative ABC transport system permease protein
MGPVAVLSFKLWRSRFNSDTHIIGHSVTLDEKHYQVIGVAPPSVSFVQSGDVWILLAPGSPEALVDRGARLLTVVGRIRQGIKERQAQSDLEVVEGRIAQSDPDSVGIKVRVVSLRQHMVEGVRRALLVLFAAVSFVLLIACTNVANLMLEKAMGRKHEVAVRMALGAGRWEILALSLTESLLLTSIAGVLGITAAIWIDRFAIAFSPQELPRVAEIAINARVLIFGVLVTAATGLVTGLVPLHVTKAATFATALRLDGRSLGGRRETKVYGWLVVAEMALTIVLLVCGGLMTRSFVRLILVDPGFYTQGLQTFQYSLRTSKYPDSQHQNQFFAGIMNRIQHLPGVESVALTSNLPVSGQSKISPVEVEGQVSLSSKREFAQHSVVSSYYFKTMGIPLLAGRYFEALDAAQGQPVAIVNLAFEKEFLPHEEAIGRSIRSPFDPQVTRKIVGIVSDVHHGGLGDTGRPEVYVPYSQESGPYMTLVVRGGAGPAMIISSVRSITSEMDQNQPIDRIVSMEQLLSESAAQPRFYTFILGLFAVMALLLSTVGIYGVVSYSVTQRTREIGVRMALGAEPVSVLQMVIWQGFVLTSAGVLIGVPIALAAAQFLSSMLYSVRPTDAWTFLSVAFLLLAVSQTACLIPAWRASKVNPTTALRYE